MTRTHLQSVALIRLAALLVCATGVALLLGPFHLPNGVDKVAHVAGFYGLTLLALAALPWNRKADILIAMSAIALSSEVAQSLAGRTMSITDMLADLTGVLAAGAPVFVAEFRTHAQRARRADRRRKAGALSVERKPL